MKAKKNYSLSIILILINNTLTTLVAFAIYSPKNRRIVSIVQQHTNKKEIMKATNNNSCCDDDDDVILGPDLNPTRSKMDKKLYRHITLSNGLQCVLICDTVAMRQRKLEHYDDESSDGDDDDDDDGSDIEGEEDDDDDDDGLRKAATALLVNVGSYHDPPHLQGLSHFLEHMLFLGTEEFPIENEYDSFLAQHGGDDNAYTDMEHTLYHYCIPQDGSSGDKTVWRALEMFSSFFKCPLLSGGSVDRELNAVESEFELNKKDDDNRLGQLMAYTCGMDGFAPIMGKEYKKEGDAQKPFHPFAKVSLFHTFCLLTFVSISSNHIFMRTS